MNLRGLGALRAHPVNRFATRIALATTLTAMVGLGVSGAGVAPATAAQTTTLTATTVMSAPDTYEQQVQRLVNVRRANHGLPRLRLASCADASAERWSRYLAANHAFFHQSMSELLRRCNAVYAGETLGRGTMPPRMLVQMWMQSPGHRAILLSPKSRRIGIGATPDATGKWVVAANFLRF